MNSFISAWNTKHLSWESSIYVYTGWPQKISHHKTWILTTVLFSLARMYCSTCTYLYFLNTWLKGFGLITVWKLVLIQIKRQSVFMFGDDSSFNVKNINILSITFCKIINRKRDFTRDTNELNMFRKCIIEVISTDYRIWRWHQKVNHLIIFI